MINHHNIIVVAAKFVVSMSHSELRFNDLLNEVIVYNESLSVYVQYCAKVMQTIIDEYRALFSRFISETSQGLGDVKTINQRDIGTIFIISRRDIVLARLHCNDISQSKTINRHNISLQRSSL